MGRPQAEGLSTDPLEVFAYGRAYSDRFLEAVQEGIPPNSTITGKWLDPAIPPELESLVLIKDGNVPPCKWNMGRIIALHPGDDNVARVATVKTSSGELKRPLVKLCPPPSC
ncbi:hypothetical protein JTB14_013356 [Gonioctena quinquepunctata]|nr:hypothetical protein JTB14_013356 [Gonioctena quinquepunctata]